MSQSSLNLIIRKNKRTSTPQVYRYTRSRAKMVDPLDDPIDDNAYQGAEEKRESRREQKREAETINPMLL